MKVKELIKLLEQQDPDKEVLIQQGEEWDYMTIHTVRMKDVFFESLNFIPTPEKVDAVVIEYL